MVEQWGEEVRGGRMMGEVEQIAPVVKRRLPRGIRVEAAAG